MDLDSFDLKRLQAFQLVARHGNLRLAAARLNQTIPAVSSRLKRLEHELGVKLFERLPNRLVLTEVGRHFLGEVEAVLQRAERALASLTGASASPGGRLTISTGFDHAWYFAPRIGNFLRHYPNADLDLRIFRAAEALRGLMAGDLDVSVGIFPSVPKTLQKEVIVDTTLSAICLPKDPLLKAPVTPAQLLRRKLIVFPSHSDTRKTFDRAVGKRLLQQKSVIEIASCQTASTFVEMGLGVGIVHSLCVGHAHPPNLRWVDLGSKFGTIPFCAVYRKGSRHSPLLRALLKELAA